MRRALLLLLTCIAAALTVTEARSGSSPGREPAL